MAATATASSVGPRYAPEDPTLPKPWRGLVDGKTGYLYFWNPETNVTQYERPTLPKSVSSLPITSSVQVHQSSHRGYNPSVKEDDRYGRANNAGSKPDAVTRSISSSNQVWIAIKVTTVLIYDFEP
jgi:ATP-dependent RNA helicase DDX5/DBP2